MSQCTTTAAALTPVNPSRKGRTKVKTGCRTCKARKVKCDELFPACNRCISTGRVCDGYGIWGGGGNGYGERYAKSHSPPEQCSVTVDLSLLTRLSERPGLTNASERAYFDWFHGQSAARLPGVFASGFWDTLLLQATVTEPCVLHAVLALSCAHKSSSIIHPDRGSPKSLLGPDKHEQFCLRQYSSAIAGLKPHFTSNSKSSVRVALIACVIFTCLEFVRGHYQSGLSHFHCGLRLLGQLKAVARGSDGIDDPALSKSEQSVDAWLAEQFARLHLQARMFGQSRSTPKVAISERGHILPISFSSVTHARKCLDRLIADATTLSERHKATRTTSPHALPSAETLEQQCNLQYALASWLEAYDKSCASLARHGNPKKNIEAVMGYKILHSYYLIARVTVATCLRLDGELAFDAFTHDFRAIMRNSAQLGEIVFRDAPGTKFQHDPALSPIVADMGWITPLYFTALKCRRRAVRRKAILFLSHGDCKEGIWDAALAAQVARQVVEIEEEGLPGGGGLDGEFGRLADAEDEEEEEGEEKGGGEGGQRPSLPLPSEASRVLDVEVLLPEGKGSGLGVLCKRRREDGSCETIVRYREVGSGRWTAGVSRD